MSNNEQHTPGRDENIQSLRRKVEEYKERIRQIENEPTGRPTEGEWRAFEEDEYTWLIDCELGLNNEYFIAECFGVDRQANAALIAQAPTLKAQRDRAVEALKNITGLIDSGYLVRNIEDDHKADWATRQLRSVQILQKAYAALAECEAGKGE